MRNCRRRRRSRCPTLAAEAVTGLILAGGQGRRMGGADKGLIDFRGRPMVAHVIERLAPQVDRLILSANRNEAAYAAFGLPVVSDRIANFPGPLAGVQAGLAACETPLLATAPCDAPHLPPDLVARLRAALAGDAMIAVARTARGTHPVFMLCRREALPKLEQWLASGERGFGAWQRRMAAVEVDFEDEAAFANINTPEELQGFCAAGS
ncbi:MAG: molybdenum cofactor guanylyltransferase [Candidatus Nitricoxidivorans perseverans]|uniref:Molybdenum cofactor guanylyltransferase n=1 Tax=Candidatus Nitricoxidivorans perseverans TaxID=2975601 RepID=A0AA49FMK2_9PROT|nr:MAG: molybdenum cofactor guanylyltransferase [Candidatus Nitricoxidivorans perseverans]